MRVWYQLITACVFHYIKLAHQWALLLHSTSRASTAHPWWVLLSMDNNCSLFAGQLIYHKRRCPKVLVPNTRTMWAKLQSASSSFIHPHYNNHTIRPIAQPESGQPSQNCISRVGSPKLQKGYLARPVYLFWLPRSWDISLHPSV